MADFQAIASAIADRFLDAAVTPPSGYDEPGTATYKLPAAITVTPMAVVFPPVGEFSFGAHKRSGNLRFPVRWYISDAQDLPRATDEMYAWAGVLIDQLEGSFELNLAPTVTHSVIDGVQFGRLEYDDHEYTGIELGVLVHLEEAYNPTTVGGFSAGFSAGFDV